MVQIILRLPTVLNRTGLSRSTIYNKVSLGDFPLPISLGPRAIGWLESDVDAWLEAQIGKSRPLIPKAHETVMSDRNSTDR